MNKLVFLIIFPLLLISLNSKAAVFDVEARGVYGGFWRDLYKLGPVVINTIGADMGIFTSPNFKIGFSFAKASFLVGLQQQIWEGEFSDLNLKLVKKKVILFSTTTVHLELHLL